MCFYTQFTDYGPYFLLAGRHGFCKASCPPLSPPLGSVVVDVCKLLSGLGGVGGAWYFSPVEDRAAAGPELLILFQGRKPCALSRLSHTYFSHTLVQSDSHTLMQHHSHTQRTIIVMHTDAVTCSLPAVTSSTDTKSQQHENTSLFNHYAVFVEMYVFGHIC